MPRVDPQQGLMPSVLDRLIDPDSGGTVWRQGYGLEQMTAAVRRDMEELLNTRQSHIGLPAEFKEVHNSLITYGLPDLTSLNTITPQQRAQIGRAIETIVARFEPRLRDVRAIMVDPGNEKERTLQFRLEARLRVDPAPEVAFDAILQLATGQYSVKSNSG